VSEAYPDVTTSAPALPGRSEREQEFWDDHIPPLEVCLAQFSRGPAPNVRLLIESLEPLRGRRVLDLGSGAGVLSAWLAGRGASVTAVDVSPRSIARSEALFDAIGLEVESLHLAFPSPTLSGRVFDRIAGRYVLHHLDLATAAPELARLLGPDGRAAFVETMATNPLLRLARRRLVGRFGFARHGTVDEQPLTKLDLAVLSREIAPARLLVADVNCAKLLDRQLLGYRYRKVSRTLAAIDSGLLAAGLGRASYHQVVLLERRAG
jgi:SAM-dependent methyltransferase